MTTKDMEVAMYSQLKRLGTYICSEVMMPLKTKERVDMLTYDKSGIWRFYELKLTVSDFHSKRYKTFYGHFNYYVMPLEVYQKVHEEIPKEIGCYSCYSAPNGSYKVFCECTRRPVKQDLTINEEDLKMSFIQALSRQQEKLIKLEKKGIVSRWEQDCRMTKLKTC